MGFGNYYQICCRHHGRNVRINDRYGRSHVGRITRVTRSHVYIQTMGRRSGYGYGFYGGFGFGPVIGIALGAITGLALASLFFW
ncbi:hypothetical protein COM86_21800 [Priestia megaterium]|jgi:hypothetical protein|uniref:Uncharacterized protein n=1 Tax=Priestia megaterium TaxID=1404 RepID=A0ABD4WN00_PRIMG|nr:hypothetical protein [Priestia megaterium]KRD85906.1 hypothetical protein ASE51_27360 [Bacillus sp. Root147]MDD9781385.1 hypothetical protein [Priestia megaterium]PEB61923.1 hypothetical protein COM86_21800 [Priestia megaterium]PEE73244.1 hypothetical protein COM81_29675 [Priestia megaterium]PFI91731.1 hypothetical protein COI84_21170 [Priestia megaterium]